MTSFKGKALDLCEKRMRQILDLNPNTTEGDKARIVAKSRALIGDTMDRLFEDGEEVANRCDDAILSLMGFQAVTLDGLDTLIEAACEFAKAEGPQKMYREHQAAKMEDPS